MTGDDRDPETYAIIGAAMDVHTKLGCGFVEAVYRDALALALTKRGIPWKREVPFQIVYDDRPLQKTFRVDYLCFEGVIVELKAVTALTNREIAQTLNYLKSSGLHRALLLNFGMSRLEYRRLIQT